MTTEINITDAAASALLTGRLDTAASGQFINDIAPLIENADRQIVLDCRNLEFISSSGLRHLLTLRKAALAKGGKIMIMGLNDDVKKVFEITGFVNLFNFV